MRLLASRDALLGVQQPRAYLTAVAKRLLVDRSRRQVIEQAYLADLALAASAQAGAPSPEEILLAVQALEEISAALEGLPDKVREAFLRHYLDEQTQARIAEDMQVSKRTIQNYLVRALLHCRTASSQMPMLP
ncbi:FIG006045: Sigma factor, ECF subfamily [plant metagenome]|uniref:FIG006045: Sigma factor, ECF subfamily n=1 Tax=plant metagenome TaxID=1297885 RepID=A0A484RE77_9ZZZZ